ncbi:MAG: DegT/DnrJ/EryC1/StrS family aminotransferase [Verrucomicrobiae bacterium]|nr:DegT/DnrJ/EryC1/StrS family aminotransferase [Verrucomicrobiae bacterium]
MNVPLLDLSRQHQALKDELMAAFAKTLDSGRFILGSEVEALEQETARYCQARHGIACASGSDALLLSLMAFGIGPGDEVITSPYSFFATASCIARMGAKAVFADISLRCFNLDPQDVLRKITPRTKAIIPVHLFGQSADMAPCLAVAREKGIKIIEDAAQAIGAEYRGQRVGGIGDVGCLSFFPTKNLGGLGDGGMLVTNDSALAEKLKILRLHGAKTEYNHQWLGINSRLDAIQASFLRIKLRHLDEWTEARQRNASLYIAKITAAGLADAPSGCQGCANPVPSSSGKPIILPAACQSRHVYNQFVIRTVNPSARNALRQFLQDGNIGSRVYYPVSLHQQPCFASWGYRAGDLPNSEAANQTSLALPIFPELTESQITHVVDSLAAFNWNSL